MTGERAATPGAGNRREWFLPEPVYVAPESDAALTQNQLLAVDVGLEPRRLPCGQSCRDPGRRANGGTPSSRAARRFWMSCISAS